jgi:hypothetical protein
VAAVEMDQHSDQAALTHRVSKITGFRVSDKLANSGHFTIVPPAGRETTELTVEMGKAGYFLVLAQGIEPEPWD